jgi:hypothetical protein
MTVVIIMMVIKAIMRRILSAIKNLEKWAEEEPEKKELTNQTQEQTGTTEVHSIWDYLDIKENTQATHLVSTVGFEEWVEMLEIKRRIRELFGLEYKNERSLYPYIKTLVDCGLFESTDIGGKRKWKKKALLLKLKQKTEQNKQEEAVSEKNQKEKSSN